jgi:hypothetical protein
MQSRAFLLSLISVWTFACVPLHAQDRNSPPLDRFVVIGDSLSAGVQNFSLLDTQQPRGYASIIARQAGWPLTLPLVPYPGIPNVLQVVSLGPPVSIEPAPGTVPFPRIDPFIQPTNIAVPGLTVGTALSLRPSATATDPETQWATVVLGFPSFYQGKAPTEIELANSLKPTTLIEWIGNNDALVPALSGQISALPPSDTFRAAYKQILDSLSLNGVRLITATVPDVTEVAYFTSVQSIALQAGQPVEAVAELLGVGVDDSVRPSAQTFVDQILTLQKPGPLPHDCPAPLPDLGVTTLPCVLTAADAQTVRAAVQCYNQAIVEETQAHGGIVVDIHALVDQVYSNGYRIPGTNTVLTTDFFGGLFSLDGIHPTATGYAVIANEFIKTMDAGFHLKIPEASVLANYLTDPLRKYASPHFVPKPVPPPAGSCSIASSTDRNKS